jgi:L-fuculose-phosphate aldolase
MRDDVVWLYRQAAARGLIVGSSGNVSARTSGGMVITPSGGDPETVTATDLAGVGLDGVPLEAGAPSGANPSSANPFSANPSSANPSSANPSSANPSSANPSSANPSSANPSSEWAMHAAIYASNPEAAFIVHTHADACTALACLGLGLPAFHYMVVQFGGEDVRCAPYVTFGTPELADHAAEAIRGRSACLLANHGMIVCAGSAAQALSRSVLLETLCRQYLLALSAGTPRLLTEQQMRDAKERFKTYGPRGGTR